MRCTNSIGAIALTVATIAATVGVRAHDESKYPDLKGQWFRVGAGSFDPSKTAGTRSNGARRSHTREARRTGRNERGGSPRIVSRLSATASDSSWRFTRSTLPSLISRPSQM